MRPHVTVNVAMSADGKLSTKERRQVKISGIADFTRVDQLKAGSDAIMVGIGTVISDDPSLTVKSVELKQARVSRGFDENPVRVVVDSRGRIPVNAAVLCKGPGKRVIGCSEAIDPATLHTLESHATVIIAGKEEVDLKKLLCQLFDMGIRNLMVEGGGTLLWSMFELGLVDEMFQYVGNMVIGGRDAPTPADGGGFCISDPFIRMDFLECVRIDEGVLLHWRMRSAHQVS
ncbi:MAG: 2,5-diamino-6-(ribosylamino)-4(3H)-pyrimidinone 5'-phosphate reductase [Methanomicrobiales archaeon]